MLDLNGKLAHEFLMSYFELILDHIAYICREDGNCDIHRAVCTEKSEYDMGIILNLVQTLVLCEMYVTSNKKHLYNLLGVLDYHVTYIGNGPCQFCETILR